MNSMDKIGSNAATMLMIAAGIGFVLVGSVMLGLWLFLDHIFDKEHANLWMMTVFLGGLPFLMGISLIIFGRKRYLRKREVDLEKEVMRVAQRHKGMVTASRFAMDARISTSDAEKVLEKMRTRGLAEIKVNTEGAYVYAFFDLIPEQY